MRVFAVLVNCLCERAQFAAPPFVGLMATPSDEITFTSRPLTSCIHIDPRIFDIIFQHMTDRTVAGDCCSSGTEYGVVGETMVRSLVASIHTTYSSRDLSYHLTSHSSLAPISLHIRSIDGDQIAHPHPLPPTP